MTKTGMIESLKAIRAEVETNEDDYSLEFAEDVIGKLDSLIHKLENHSS